MDILGIFVWAFIASFEMIAVIAGCVGAFAVGFGAVWLVVQGVMAIARKIKA